MTQRILPKVCGLCESTRLTWDGWTGDWSVYCPDCNHSTTGSATKEEAVRVWRQSVAMMLQIRNHTYEDG